MRKKNKALLRILPALAVPCVLAMLFFLLMIRLSDIRFLFFLLYALTLVWVGFFLAKKFSRISLLPLSFLLSLLGPFLYDAQGSGMFRYMRTSAMALMYALPWTAATLVVAAVILFRERRKRKGSIDYEL